MKLIVNKKTGEIAGLFDDLVAGNHKMESPDPQIPEGFSLVSVEGDAEKYNWPHPNGASACILKAGKIIANPAVPVP